MWQNLPPLEATLHLLQNSLGCSLQQFLGILLWIAFTEHGVARYQNFRPCPDYFGDSIEGDAAIYLNPITEPPLRPQLRELADLMHRPGNKLLPTETRIYRHDQHIIDDVRHFAQRFYGRGWVNHDSCPRPM